MTQISLKIPDIVTDAAFPPNAKGFLRLQHMQRALQQMCFSRDEIEGYKLKLRTSAYIVLAEEFGEVAYERGMPSYNCNNVRYELDGRTPNGFIATDDNLVDRGRHQLFMDDEKFHKRLRELFRQELNGDNQFTIAKVEEGAKAAPEPAAKAKRRLFLIKNKELATPVANL